MIDFSDATKDYAVSQAVPDRARLGYRFIFI